MTQKQLDEEVKDWQEEEINQTDQRNQFNREQGVQKPVTQQDRKDFFNDH